MIGYMSSIQCLIGANESSFSTADRSYQFLISHSRPAIGSHRDDKGVDWWYHLSQYLIGVWIVGARERGEPRVLWFVPIKLLNLWNRQSKPIKSLIYFFKINTPRVHVACGLCQSNFCIYETDTQNQLNHYIFYFKLNTPGVSIASAHAKKKAKRRDQRGVRCGWLCCKEVK